MPTQGSGGRGGTEEVRRCSEYARSAGAVGPIARPGRRRRGLLYKGSDGGKSRLGSLPSSDAELERLAWMPARSRKSFGAPCSALRGTCESVVDEKARAREGPAVNFRGDAEGSRGACPASRSDAQAAVQALRCADGER